MTDPISDEIVGRVRACCSEANGELAGGFAEDMMRLIFSKHIAAEDAIDAAEDMATGAGSAIGIFMGMAIEKGGRREAERFLSKAFTAAVRRGLPASHDVKELDHG